MYMNPILYQLIYPTYFISNILFSSGLTAFLICECNGKSFVNPELYCHEYFINKVNKIGHVGKYVVLNYNIVYFLLSQYYLHNETYGFVFEMGQTVKFVLLLEFIAYVYHRMSHRFPLLYNGLHSIHHRNMEVYPIDFLEFDLTDNIAQTLYINLPLYFVPMNIYTYTLVYYIYATGAFLIHSDLLNNDHVIHHKYFKYNFALLLPIFDILFGTYRTKMIHGE